MSGARAAAAAGAAAVNHRHLYCPAGLLPVRRQDKERENLAALEALPHLLSELDEMPPPQRLLALVQVGNGSQRVEVAGVHQEATSWTVGGSTAPHDVRCRTLLDLP